MKEISQFHGLLEGHASLKIGEDNLRCSRESKALQEQSLARLSELENMLATIHATFVRFSKDHDIHQTANFLRQCVDESLQESEQRPTSEPTVKLINGVRLRRVSCSFVLIVDRELKLKTGNVRPRSIARRIFRRTSRFSSRYLSP